MKSLIVVRLVEYVAVGLVVAFIFSIFFTDWWNSSDQYSTNQNFVGCYSDETGDIIELSQRGVLSFRGRGNGIFRIVAPVGGKHGYLIEVSNLNLSLDQEARIVASPGSGGFLWPISQTGEITVTFAPDNRRLFERTKCQR